MELVLKQVGSTDIGVLRNIYRSEFYSYERELVKIRGKGIQYLVLDLSSVPKKEKLEYMGVLMGIFLNAGIEVKCIGIKKEDVAKGDLGTHRSYMLGSVHRNLESALKALG